MCDLAYISDPLRKGEARCQGVETPHVVREAAMVAFPATWRERPIRIAAGMPTVLYGSATDSKRRISCSSPL